MVENVKINLKFSKFIVSKVIANLIKKKTKSTVKIEIKELEIINDNGEVKIAVNLNANMKEVDFDNLLSQI